MLAVCVITGVITAHSQNPSTELLNATNHEWVPMDFESQMVFAAKNASTIKQCHSLYRAGNTDRFSKKSK